MHVLLILKNETNKQKQKQKQKQNRIDLIWQVK